LGFLVPGGKRRDKQPLVEATWELVSCLGHSSYLVTAGNFWILQSKEVKPWEVLEDRPSPEVQWSGLWGELLSCTDRHRVLAIRSLSKTSLLRLTATRVGRREQKGNLRRRGGRCGLWGWMCFISVNSKLEVIRKASRGVESSLGVDGVEVEGGGCCRLGQGCSLSVRCAVHR
jgi:hypothetical protein